MKMKKMVAAAMVACMAMSLGAGMTASADDVVELKWGSVHPETAVTTQMMMKAVDEINANAEGVHVTGYHHRGTLTVCFLDSEGSSGRSSVFVAER